MTPMLLIVFLLSTMPVQAIVYVDSAGMVHIEGNTIELESSVVNTDEFTFQAGTDSGNQSSITRDAGEGLIFDADGDTAGTPGDQLVFDAGDLELDGNFGIGIAPTATMHIEKDVGSSTLVDFTNTSTTDEFGTNVTLLELSRTGDSTAPFDSIGNITFTALDDGSVTSPSSQVFADIRVAKNDNTEDAYGGSMTFGVADSFASGTVIDQMSMDEFGVRILNDLTIDNFFDTTFEFDSESFESVLIDFYDTQSTSPDTAAQIEIGSSVNPNGISVSTGAGALSVMVAIDENGNLGIGDNTDLNVPYESKLDLDGSMTLRAASEPTGVVDQGKIWFDTTAGELRFKNGTGSATAIGSGGGGGGGGAFTSSGGDTVLNTIGDQVGIGEASPTFKLEVNDTPASTAVARIRNSKSTNNDSARLPVLSIDVDSDPATTFLADDNLGSIVFRGLHDGFKTAPAMEVAAEISAMFDSKDEDNEVGGLDFAIMGGVVGGQSSVLMSMRQGSISIDTDLEIGTNNTSTLRVLGDIDADEPGSIIDFAETVSLNTDSGVASLNFFDTVAPGIQSVIESNTNALNFFTGAGNTTTVRMNIDPSGNVAIGDDVTAVSTLTLGEVGTNATFRYVPSDTITSGHVLTTDASGNATWQAAAGGGGSDTDWTESGNNLIQTGTGVVQINDGSVTAPSLRFDGDADTGLYAPLATNIAVATNGVHRQRWYNNGQVAIGDAVSLPPAAITFDVQNGALRASTIQQDLGSASAPTYSFNGDTNTGMFSTGADNVAISTGGTYRMRFYNSLGNGNVSIGNSVIDFDHKLTLSTDQAADGLAISNTATDGDPIVQFQLGTTGTFTMGVDDGDSDKFKIGTTAIGTNTRMAIDSVGNVGIGESSPSTKLEISNNNSSELPLLRIENTGTGDAAIGFNLASGNFWSIGVDDSDSDKFKIATFDTSVSTNTRMTIDASGNVGISETSPATRLHLNGQMTYEGTTEPTGVAGEGKIWFDSTAGAFRYKDGTGSATAFGGGGGGGDFSDGGEAASANRSLGNTTNHNLGFLTLGSERVTIEGLGEVGINETTPDHQLDVNGDIAIENVSGNQFLGPQLAPSTAPAYSFEGDTDNGMDWVATNKIGLVTNGNLRLGIDGEGDVAIGSNIVGTTLDVIFEVQCPTSSSWISVKDNSNGGSQLGCIQQVEQATSSTWFNATNTCFTQYGGRLPTSEEWYLAANNYALTNETGNYEWVSDRVFVNGIGHGFGVVGNASITDINFDMPTNNRAYRCFVPH